jgi:outer membrane protein TolC
VRYALQNSRHIQSASIDLETQKRAGDTAWNTLLPNLETGGTITRTNEVMGAPGMSISERDHWSMGGSIGVSLNFNISLHYCPK